MLKPMSTVPYIIQTNDTFYKISKHFSITLDALLEVNPGINPDDIKQGQVIYLPITPPHFNCPSISEIYTLKEGDTMYTLSQKYKIKLNTLIKSNPHINPDSPLAGQSICIPKLWSTYHNESFKVEFMYPVRWAKIKETFYEGLDGFFKLSGLNSDKSLEELCETEAHHKLKPYGTHPSIIRIEASSRAACLVVPSEDQPMEMNGQSALILKYNTPIFINEAKYTHLILWADIQHLKDIMDTLVLLD